MRSTRTVYIGGLPPKCSNREVYNCFRFFPGYEILRTSSTEKFTTVYVRFASPSDANYAISQISGHVWDPEENPDVRVQARLADSEMTMRVNEENPFALVRQQQQPMGQMQMQPMFDSQLSHPDMHVVPQAMGRSMQQGNHFAVIGQQQFAPMQPMTATDMPAGQSFSAVSAQQMPMYAVQATAQGSVLTMPSGAHSMSMAPSYPTGSGFGSPPSFNDARMTHAPSSMGATFVRQRATTQTSVPVCNTIYVPVIHDQHTENALRSSLQSMPGFVKFKTSKAGGGRMQAFTRFTSEHEAKAAREALDGTVLLGGDGVVLTVGYATKPMNLDKNQRNASPRSNSIGPYALAGGGQMGPKMGSGDGKISVHTSLWRKSPPSEVRISPCDTIFFPFLVDQLNPPLFEAILGSLQGFKRLKTSPARRGGLQAFVQFNSEEDATKAREALDGMALQGTEQAMVVGYASRPMS